jgi:hypothetical protein
MPATHLPDGYTRESLIPAGDSHPETCIVYRPMLAAERRRLALQTVRLNSHGPDGCHAAAQLMAAALAARLVSWDLFDSRGGLVEITPTAVASLDPALFESIHKMVARFDDEERSAKN